MLKSIALTGPQKLVLGKLLGTPSKSNLEMARTIREFRRRFELPTAMKFIDKLNEKLSSMGLEAVNWEEFLDLEGFDERLEEFREKLSVQEKPDEKLLEKLERCRIKFAKFLEPVTLTIDDLYLKELQKFCTEKDWNTTMKVAGPGGTVVDVPSIPASAHLEIFADLVDQVNSSLAAPSIESTKAEKE